MIYNNKFKVTKINQNIYMKNTRKFINKKLMLTYN